MQTNENFAKVFAKNKRAPLVVTRNLKRSLKWQMIDGRGPNRIRKKSTVCFVAKYKIAFDNRIRLKEAHTYLLKSIPDLKHMIQFDWSKSCSVRLPRPFRIWLSSPSQECNNSPILQQKTKWFWHKYPQKHQQTDLLLKLTNPKILV